MAHVDGRLHRRILNEEKSNMSIGKSKILIASIAVLTVVGVFPASQSAQASVWALSGDLNAHDPCIFKEGGTWWVARTWAAGIGMEWSSDGHAWNTGGPIFSGGLSWWGQYNGNSTWTWAPSLGDYNGIALCYYAVSTFGSQHSAIGLATASTIGTVIWGDQGPSITSSSSNNYNAIDPCFTTDSSGAPWLSFGSWSTGIYLTKLSTSTYKPTGSWYHIAYNSSGIENSQIVYQGGYYYLFASVGTCCNGASSTYHIVYGRSTSITGPYLDLSGTNMLNGGGTTLDSGGSRFIAPGGESVYNDGNGWVCARHELDSQNGYATVLFINDLYWVNGWPTYQNATISNGAHALVPQNDTGARLDANAWSSTNGTKVQIWNGSTQTWQFTNVGGNVYQISEAWSPGACLDVVNGGGPGTNVDVWSCWGGTPQQWTAYNDGGNIYEFEPQCSLGSRLDVYNGGTASGTQVRIWYGNGYSAQQWGVN